MFNKVSKAGVGLAIVLVLNAILPTFGLVIPEAQVATFVDAWGNIIGFALLIWGQLDRDDLTLGLMRK